MLLMRRIFWRGLGLLCILCFLPVAVSHPLKEERSLIISSGLTKSFQSAHFILNLNPIVWEQVWPRLEIIIDEWEKKQPEKTKGRVELTALRKYIEAGADKAQLDRVSWRKQGQKHALALLEKARLAIGLEKISSDGFFSEESHIEDQSPTPRQILGMKERGAQESETPLIALGDMAFDSPLILGEPARSLQITCNTCHNKGATNPAFFIPGLSQRSGGLDVSGSFFAPHANNGVFDHVDIPDLRGIRFTAPYGRNGRTASLREFTRNVIVHEFNGLEPDSLILDSLVAYMNEFEFLPNPKIHRDGTLSDLASSSAKRGEKIFHRPFPQMMRGKSCASCHQPDSHFIDHKRHDLGTVPGFSPHSLNGALDTPTLLSSKYTAPYFHDGSLASLSEVVLWFNQRFSLGLGEKEVKDLTSYLEEVGEGLDPYEKGGDSLVDELDELETFLSTYEYLESISHKKNLSLTLLTIAQKIEGQISELNESKQVSLIEKMASLIKEADRFLGEGKMFEAKSRIEKYRKLYRKNLEYLK